MTWDTETAVRTLWMEARGEPLAGMQAVSRVIWNRLRDGRWGHTLAAVCLAPMQFSCWDEHDKNRMIMARCTDDFPPFEPLRKIFTDAGTAPDLTGGAMWYYAPAGVIMAPHWAEAATLCGKFGSQLFYKDVK